MMKKVLILTNKDDITVDFVVRELRRRKINYYRLNTEDIPSVVSINFDINNKEYKLLDKIKNIEINLLDFDSVYFRRPLISDLSYIEGISESEIYYLRSELTFVLEGIYKVLREKYWLNNVYNIREAENKIYQLEIAKDIGFNIPRAVISNDIDMLKSIGHTYSNDLIIKPIKSGNIKYGDVGKAIFTTKINEEQFEDRERIESFPIFMQSNIHKKVDLRCTVVGDEVFVAEIHSQVENESMIDWRKGKKILKHKEHILPNHIKKMCIELTQRLNLNYSAIDMILDENNNYIFLEINPNGQWAWIENRLQFPISKKIVDLLMKGDLQ